MNYEDIIKSAEAVSVRNRETVTSLVEVKPQKTKKVKSHKSKKYSVEELADRYLKLREKDKKYDWTAQFLNYLHERE